MSDCMSNAKETSVMRGLCGISPTLQVFKPVIMASVMNGSVWLSSSQHFRLSMAVDHVLSAPWPLQRVTCSAGSGQPQRGHLSTSHFPHCFIHLPTPQISTVCLVMKCCLARGMPLRASPIAPQLTTLIVSSEALPFCFQCSFACGACAML